MKSEINRPRFDAAYVGGAFRVLDFDGRPLAKGFLTLDAARTERDRLQAAEDLRRKRGPRACMCCGQTFQSDGIHHRLCATCGAQGEGHAMTAGATSIGKIRRAAQA